MAGSNVRLSRELLIAGLIENPFAIEPVPVNRLGRGAGESNDAFFRSTLDAIAGPAGFSSPRNLAELAPLAPGDQILLGATLGESGWVSANFHRLLVMSRDGERVITFDESTRGFFQFSIAELEPFLLRNRLEFRRRAPDFFTDIQANLRAYARTERSGSPPAAFTLPSFFQNFMDRVRGGFHWQEPSESLQNIVSRLRAGDEISYYDPIENKWFSAILGANGTYFGIESSFTGVGQAMDFSQRPLSLLPQRVLPGSVFVRRGANHF
jgi:hypothetical protein